MQISKIDDRKDIYIIYYIVIVGMCLLILILFNLLIYNRAQQHKEAMVNNIKAYNRSQTYNIDRGMESMLNTVFVQKGALEEILSYDGPMETTALLQKLKYNEHFDATYVKDTSDELGNIFIEGRINEYTNNQRSEIDRVFSLFTIQSLLQNHTIFDIWSVYYSKEGYVLMYPYMTLEENIPKGEKLEIKDLVKDSIKSIIEENDQSIINEGWQTDAFYDLTNNVLMFSKSIPVKKHGEIVGIMTCNMNVEEIANFITPADSGIDIYIIDNGGRVLYENGVFNEDLSDAETVLNERYDVSLSNYVNLMDSRETNLKDFYFCASKFKRTNWTLLTVANHSITDYMTFEKIGIFILGNLIIIAFSAAIIILLRKYHKKEKEIETMKTDFLMSVSHDLKSPMMIVMGYLEHLKMLIKENTATSITSKEMVSKEYEIEKDIAIIEKEGIRLKKMINNLLELSKLRFGEVTLIKSKININEWLKDIKIAVEHEAAKKQIVVHNKAKTQEQLYCYGDKEMLDRVLMNLISNALDATDQGEIELYAREDNNHICIEVTDTGTGMTQAEQKNIFKSFNTNKKQGTGLGLTIAQNIVERHRGYIGCQSEEGKGSTFYFCIPIE